MENNFVNGIQHKRVSELRKNDFPTLIVSNQNNVLQNDQSSEILIFEGANKIPDEIEFRQDHSYSKQDSTFSEYSSKGCISRIPLIPTVTLYILVIIVIGMALAFNGRKSRRIETLIQIQKVIEGTAARGLACSEDIFLFPSRREMEGKGWNVDVGLDIFSMDEKELDENGIDDIDAINQIKDTCKMDSWFGFDSMLGNANITKVFGHDGEAILSFGNCGDIFQSGSVTATIRSQAANNVIGTASQGVYNITKAFNFTTNDVLNIEEHEYGIIKLISFEVVC